jgi:hypothetical protein
VRVRRELLVAPVNTHDGLILQVRLPWQYWNQLPPGNRLAEVVERVLLLIFRSA